MRKAKILGPKDGELFDVVGDRYRFLVDREDTESSYGLLEAVVPPGGGPPPHSHSREEEGFYVIAGEITIYVDGVETVAGPGSFINMPKGSTHWFRNNSQQDARLLIVVAPGGMEQMFREVGTPVKNLDEPIAPVGEDEKRKLVQAASNFGIELKIGSH